MLAITPLLQLVVVSDLLLSQFKIRKMDNIVLCLVILII